MVAPIPADYSPGDTPTAAEVNAILANLRDVTDRLNATVTRTVYQVADQALVSTTVLVSSTYLTLPLDINSAYTFEALLIYDTNATADFKYSMLLPAGSFIRQGVWTAVTSATATNTTIGVDAIDATAVNGGGVAGGVMMTMRPTGIIASATTPGNATVQFAQVTSNATNATTLKIGSWMRLTKVA